jgi:N6-L-threonylcarbamoyladenine synthase
MPTGLILGIESSCDETAAAVVRAGAELLSSAVASQIVTHAPFGGVVPELASREHLRAIAPVVRKALADAGVGLNELDAIAVTQGPGLPGALLVGISYAKALAFAADKPVITVNHLEGHIHAVLLEQRQQQADAIAFPLLALVVSGGHTHLYLAEQRASLWHYQNVGRTRDDAAGEAFDKVAKLLGLGYPGGPIIEMLAKHGDSDAVKFTAAQIKHAARGTSRKRPDVGHQLPVFDFSYSGMKTAVLRYVETQDLKPEIDGRVAALRDIAKPQESDLLPLCSKTTLDLVASFQRGMVDDLVGKTMHGVEEFGAVTLFVTGGVAANSELRRSFERECSLAAVEVAFPSQAMSTDNAAMIAAAAYPKLLAGEVASEDFSAEASLQLR